LTFFWGVHEGEGGQEPLGFPREHGNPRQVHTCSGSD
jgi:hypothetical protein